MKNKILLLLTVISVFTFTSCKKKIETCKLGKCYITDGSTSPLANTFSYGSDGRLKKIFYSNQTSDSLVYYADSLSIFTTDDRDSLLSEFTAVLNAGGFVTSAIKVSYNYLGNISETETYALGYNAAGNLTTQTITNSLGTSILTLNYTGGNSDTGTLYRDTSLMKRFVFYHNSVANKTGIDDMNGVFTPYFGVPSVNLLDSTHIYTSTDTIRIQYAHTIDANDYVQKTIQTYLSPGVQTKFFTYQYFDCLK